MIANNCVVMMIFCSEILKAISQNVVKSVEKHTLSWKADFSEVLIRPREEFWRGKKCAWCVSGFRSNGNANDNCACGRLALTEIDFVICKFNGEGNFSKLIFERMETEEGKLAVVWFWKQSSEILLSKIC